jgi:hypothetical protein
MYFSFLNAVDTSREMQVKNGEKKRKHLHSTLSTEQKSPVGGSVAAREGFFFTYR